MDSQLTDLLAKRRDRAIAIILRVKEQECDKHLPMDSSIRMRKVVLDQMNGFYDLCADIVNSLDNGGTVLNEHWLRKIDELHDHIVGNGKSP
jgi:hypothetical protein